MFKIIVFTTTLGFAIVAYLSFYQQSTSVIDQNNKQENRSFNQKPTPVVIEPGTETEEKKPAVNIGTPPASPLQNSAAMEQPQTEHIDQDSDYSYPLEDAEFYFIPPEQRYPGNIGGPPPLELPDSPSKP